VVVDLADEALGPPCRYFFLGVQLVVERCVTVAPTAGLSSTRPRGTPALGAEEESDSLAWLLCV